MEIKTCNEKVLRALFHTSHSAGEGCAQQKTNCVWASDWRADSPHPNEHRDLLAPVITASIFQNPILKDRCAPECFWILKKKRKLNTHTHKFSFFRCLSCNKRTLGPLSVLLTFFSCSARNDNRHGSSPQTTPSCCHSSAQRAAPSPTP